MPIVVVCPSCATRLSAPDAAAGKHVRCPAAGCGTLVPVPAVVQAEVVKEPPRPKPRPVPARDEDDDRDDRPRQKKRRRDDDDDTFDRRRRRQGGGATRVFAIITIVSGSLLVLGGIGYGIYALAGKKSGTGSGSGSDNARRSSPPAGWQQFTYPDDGFRAYFPAEPQVHTSAEGKFDLPLVAGHRPESFTLYMPPRRGPGVVVDVTVVRFRSSFTIDRHQLINQIRKEHGEVTDKPITWLGGDGYEVAAVDLPVVSRIVLIDRTMYLVTLASIGGPMSAAERNGFFDNFELLKE